MILSDWIASYRVRGQAFSARLQGMARVFIGGFAASVGGYMASSLLGALVQTLTVRRLGVEGYGEYTTVIASLSLLSIVLGFGLDTWLLKEGGHSPERLAQSLWQILLLKLAGAAVLVVILAVGWSSHVAYTPAFLTGVVWGVLGSFTLTGFAALRAARRNLQVAAFQTLEPVLLLIILLTISPAHMSVQLLLLVRLASAAVLFALLIRQVWAVSSRQAAARFSPLTVLRSSWLYIAADGLAIIYNQAPVAILAASAGAAAVGVFGGVINLIMLIYSVPNLMFVVALPLLSAVEITPPEYRRLLKLMAAGSLLYGLSALAGLALLGDWLLVRMYGPEFAAAQPFLLALSVTPLLKAFGFVSAAIMLSRDTVHLRVGSQIFGALLSVAGCWLAVPIYGVAGAVAVVLAVEVLLFALYGLAALYTLRSRL